ncbi:MAG: hypothetical protein NC324_02980 [Bacteroides sp.]|nr:hypothetical protein [Bacteroides sp.]
MFERNRQKEIDPRMIDASSKITLKLSCMQACKGDVEEAKKMYDFFSGDMNLPDYPEPRLGAVQKFTQQADALFGWVDQNGEKFLKGFNMIQMLRGRAPIPFQQAAGAAAENAIPPLNPVN